ncbi:hypothetical protein KBD34_03235 [Patescibacteria group bacterium]|nr:hypothetical protein [Patescibacteria group bacterium]
MTTAHFAPPAAISDRLLTEAVRRHEIASAAIPAVHDLLRRGLSFEQALVGTGLISFQTFTDWMREATGLPMIVPAKGELRLPSGLDESTLTAWQVIPERVGDKRWTIGLTNPWDQEARSALETIAAEQGWAITFAYVPLSLADRWFATHWMGRARRASSDYFALARTALARAKNVPSLHISPEGRAQHPKSATFSISAHRLPALRLRLARRAIWSDTAFEQKSDGLHLRSVPKTGTPLPVESETEHPIRDWTNGLQRFFTDKKLVFLLDPSGDNLHASAATHFAYDSADWRAGERWEVPAQPVLQEELFHLALSGYPGTVHFHSLADLRAWELAAEAQSVPYAACIGRPTPQGSAWMLYAV